MKRKVSPTSTYQHRLPSPELRSAFQISPEYRLMTGIWRFTLYWTFILLSGTYLLCALWASTNIAISLLYLQPKIQARSDSFLKSPISNGRILRKKRIRPPWWPLLVMPVIMVAVATFISLITGSVIGFALAAVYDAGAFTMST